jgi:AcrR family transcriptional regulator
MSAVGRTESLPPTVRGRATRDRILDCAAALLFADGVAALSLDNVRQAAGVSGSQLSHYFVDKDTLISAVVGRQIEVLLDFHRQPDLGNLDTFEDFERWAELTIKLNARRSGEPLPTFGGLAGQLSKHDEAIRKLLADGYQRWLSIIRAGLTRMKKNGLLVAEADPAVLAHVLIAAHEGGALMGSAYDKAWPDREALTYALAYLRRFAARPHEQSTPDRGKRPRAARRTHV